MEKKRDARSSMEDSTSSSSGTNGSDKDITQLLRRIERRVISVYDDTDKILDHTMFLLTNVKYDLEGKGDERLYKLMTEACKDQIHPVTDSVMTIRRDLRNEIKVLLESVRVIVEASRDRVIDTLRSGSKPSSEATPASAVTNGQDDDTAASRPDGPKDNRYMKKIKNDISKIISSLNSVQTDVKSIARTQQLRAETGSSLFGLDSSSAYSASGYASSGRLRFEDVHSAFKELIDSLEESENEDDESNDEERKEASSPSVIRRGSSMNQTISAHRVASLQERRRIAGAISTCMKKIGGQDFDSVDYRSNTARLEEIQSKLEETIKVKDIPERMLDEMYLNRFVRMEDDRNALANEIRDLQRKNSELNIANRTLVQENLRVKNSLRDLQPSVSLQEASSYMLLRMVADRACEFVSSVVSKGRENEREELFSRFVEFQKFNFYLGVLRQLLQEIKMFGQVLSTQKGEHLRSLGEKIHLVVKNADEFNSTFPSFNVDQVFISRSWESDSAEYNSLHAQVVRAAFEKTSSIDAAVIETAVRGMTDEHRKLFERLYHTVSVQEKLISLLQSRESSVSVERSQDIIKRIVSSIYSLIQTQQLNVKNNFRSEVEKLNTDEISSFEDVSRDQFHGSLLFLERIASNTAKLDLVLELSKILSDFDRRNLLSFSDQVGSSVLEMKRIMEKDRDQVYKYVQHTQTAFLKTRPDKRVESLGPELRASLLPAGRMPTSTSALSRLWSAMHRDRVLCCVMVLKASKEAIEELDTVFPEYFLDTHQHRTAEMRAFVDGYKVMCVRVMKTLETICSKIEFATAAMQDVSDEKVIRDTVSEIADHIRTIRMVSGSNQKTIESSSEFIREFWKVVERLKTFSSDGNISKIMEKAQVLVVEKYYGTQVKKGEESKRRPTAGSPSDPTFKTASEVKRKKKDSDKRTLLHNTTFELDGLIQNRGDEEFPHSDSSDDEAKDTKKSAKTETTKLPRSAAETLDLNTETTGRFKHITGSDTEPVESGRLESSSASTGETHETSGEKEETYYFNSV